MLVLVGSQPTRIHFAADASLTVWKHIALCFLLSVEDNIVKTEFSVYPNPFNNDLNVSSQIKVENLRLYNISGQLVKQVKNSNSLNVSELAKGIYILEVTADATREIRKVIKN